MKVSTARLTRDDLARRDAADPLRGFQDDFELPDGVLYLDGNSLGALPKATVSRMAQVVREEWGRDLIRSWTVNDWIGLPTRVGGKIARIVGAADGEVAVADSTSVNLFKLLAAALKLRPERRVILTEEGNFPTDVYIAQGLIDLLGGRHTLRRVAAGDIAQAVDEETAVVMVTHVNYQTGAMHDLAGLTAAAHDRGRADAVGPVALGRRGTRRSERRRRRLRGRLRLQISQRRAWRAGVPVHRGAAPRCGPAAALGLDGARIALRLRGRLPSRAGHRAQPRGDPAGAVDVRAGGRRRSLPARRHGRHSREVDRPDRGLHPTAAAGMRGRRDYGRQPRRSGATAAARSRCVIRTVTPSSRR